MVTRGDERWRAHYKVYMIYNAIDLDLRVAEAMQTNQQELREHILNDVHTIFDACGNYINEMKDVQQQLKYEGVVCDLL